MAHSPLCRSQWLLACQPRLNKTSWEYYITLDNMLIVQFKGIFSNGNLTQHYRVQCKLWYWIRPISCWTRNTHSYIVLHKIIFWRETTSRLLWPSVCLYVCPIWQYTSFFGAIVLDNVLLWFFNHFLSSTMSLGIVLLTLFLSRVDFMPLSLYLEACSRARRGRPACWGRARCRWRPPARSRIQRSSRGSGYRQASRPSKKGDITGRIQNNT